MTPDEAIEILGFQLSIREKQLGPKTQQAIKLGIEALKTRIEPTERERRFLALAIQGITLRQGPPVFPFALSLARKLGLEEYLTEYLQSWVEYGESQALPGKTKE